MSLNLQLPENTVLKPQITVFGVGGAGCNATNNMIRSNLEGANFVVANTDAQALESAEADKRIQLGRNTTKGLGAGASPEVGRIAAEETIDEITDHLQGSNMVFITAGMGGGTGTGAAPVIAGVARSMDILTVGVVTKPFHFEGPRRMQMAEAGLEELQKNVDTLIIIPNQNLFRVANESTTFADAFTIADDVLHAGVRGVTDLMVMPGLINLDFADVRSVMSEMGKAMMGTGEAEGENRAIEAAEAAISNPLLDNVSMKGAKGVLINITGGPDMTLFEVDEAANRIREEVDGTANIIFGSTFSEALEGKLRVSVVATGIDSENDTQGNDPRANKVTNQQNQAQQNPQQQMVRPNPNLQTTNTNDISANNKFLDKTNLNQTATQPQRQATQNNAGGYNNKQNHEAYNQQKINFTQPQQNPSSYDNKSNISSDDGSRYQYVSPPKVEQPNSYAQVTSEAPTDADANTYYNNNESNNNHNEEDARSGGLFSKVAKVARSFQGHESNYNNNSHFEENSSKEDETNSNNNANNDYDIPAFLRKNKD